MKILISVDWEGIAGIVNWHQEGEDRTLTRKLMTGEVNAAIAGALQGGATEIVVNDAHGSMRNILLEELNPEARLISGDPKELSMVQGVQDDVDAAVFIGYHSKAGTCRAILDHTYSGSAVQEIRLNGTPVGEATLNAYVCGVFAVPVIAVSGDDSLAEEVKTLGAEHIVVKEAYSRYSANHFHPEVARAKIQTGVRTAVSHLAEYAPKKFEGSVTIELDLTHSAMVEMADLIPGVQKIGPRTVAYTADDYLTIFKVMLALVTLAGSVLKG